MTTPTTEGVTPAQIEKAARAIFESHNATYTFGGPAKWDADPDHWRRYARAALSSTGDVK